jgi:serine/threonine protein kinase
MSITTTEAFLKALRTSKLLSAEQIATVREMAAEVDRPKSLARRLRKQKLLTRWQAGQLLAGRTSFFLGRYKLVDLLGRGGMGSVFSAEDTKMNRSVALKVISKQLSQDPVALERFFAEARAIAALDHPNIVRAYDVDNASDRYFIVMEFAEGRNLQEVVESEGPLGYALAADYIRQAAEGLAHAHSREIVHRDVKPANLVVNDRGVVKVLDMGMARLVAGQVAEGDGADDGGGEDDGLLGTVDYLAPEQAMGGPDVDHRVDLYSLGCTLYFLLTGSPPFPEGALPERIIKHQTQAPPPVRDRRPDAPEQLVAVCEKLMAKDADDRFPSADDVARLLADWQPPEDELQAAIPIAEPAAEDEPKEVIKIAEPVFAEEPESEGVGPLGMEIDTSGSSIGQRTGSSVHRRQDKPRLGNVERLLADRRIVIAAALVGAIVVVGIISGLFFLFSGGDRTDVAEATPDEASQAADVPGSDNGGNANEDEKGEKDEEILPKMDLTDGNLGELQAPVDDKAKKEPGSAPKPEGKPAGEPDKPKAAAEEDIGKPEDVSKPAGKPATEPGEPEKPQGQAEKKPDEGTKPKTNTPKKPEEPKPPETTPPPPPPEPVKPLEKLKEVVPIAELRDKDRPGEASRAPLSMGPINAPDTANVQLDLLGGDEVLKGDRKFTLAVEEGAKASWLIQLDAAEAGGGRVVSPVARISRAGKGLSFQWSNEARSTPANYLRNCMLQVRLDGQSKYLRLGEPVIAEPIILDLVGGRANQTATVKWLPNIERLRIAIIGIEGRKDFSMQPEEPVPPRTPIGLVFARKDRHGNISPGVQFRIMPATRRAAVNFDVRLAVTREIEQIFRTFESWRFSLQQLGTAQDKIAADKEKLARQLSTAKGSERDKISRNIDGLDIQLWYLDFYTNIHKRAKLHYRIFIEVDGHEVVLATSTTKPAK